ncbi:hypothetical protein ACIBU0_01855 [Streptomyces sp. NPDC049627]|uniref:hypothetical protein n=1 Tax=Streptomyces sp. NPDC049627 TaxID=3365595 RepID=UPI0037AF6F8C
MPTHPPTPTPLWRRLGPALRGTFVMALILCAVMHGLPEKAHASVPVPAGVSATVTDEDPHGHHVPHGIEDCSADAMVRTAARAGEDLPLGVPAVVVLVAVFLSVGRPLVRHASRRRRSARTGRAALVRTSRWRI